MQSNHQNQEPNSQIVDQSQEHSQGQLAPPQSEVPENSNSIPLKETHESSQQYENISKPQADFSSNKSSESPMDIEKSPLQRKKQAYTNGKDGKNKILCDMNLYFSNKLYGKLASNAYCQHSIIPAEDEDRKLFSLIFKEMADKKEYSAKELNLTEKQSRGIAAVMGMAIGDALGASTQFQQFNKQGLGIIKNGFKDIHQGILQGKIRPRSNKVSIWTDDASMGLCMADSILLNDYEFNPTHMRYMFIVWLENGLNNGGRYHSIGLGGNISISMNQFMHHQEKYTERGDRFNNGNGSLMRLAPVPVAYSDNLKQGVQNSGLQSLTTHNGLEAQECSKLMANIIIELIHRDKEVDGKDLIIKVCDRFKSQAKSVEFLAKGQQQSNQLYEQSCKLNKQFKRFNKSLKDRNWDWREKSHTYSPCRNKQQPGYIGSYCMDALSMALHTVMFSDSFKEVVNKNADMGGDCDTVGSIAGQIAGALYGVDNQMLELYSEMQDFRSTRYDVFLKGYKLINKKKL